MADIQLFRERLSEKVHATIPKGIVGGFEFAVLQRNLKEWHERPWTYVCACQRKATKEVLTATVSGTVYWSHVAFPNRSKRHIPYYLSGSSRAHSCIPMSCSVLFKLRNRFKNMIKTKLLMCSRVQFSRNKPYLLVRFVAPMYTIFNRSWSGLNESARGHVNFQCWKTILPSKFDLHTQVSSSILSSRRSKMDPTNVICGIKKKHFIILFLNLKLGKFYVETFCTHNVVFVQQEEQDHAIVSWTKSCS